jgi:hypothetical protein
MTFSVLDPLNVCSVNMQELLPQPTLGQAYFTFTILPAVVCRHTWGSIFFPRDLGPVSV